MEGLYTISGGPGVSICIVCGIHGDEYPCVDAVMDAYRHLDKCRPDVKGSVHFIVANTRALQIRKRFVDRDLNRSFLNQNETTGVYEYSRAYELSKFLRSIGHISGLLDLHTVSADNSRATLVEYAHIESITLRNNINFTSLSIEFDDEELKGSMLSFAVKQGIPSVAVECGNTNDSDSYYFSLRCVEKFIKHFNIFNYDDDGDEDKRDSKVLRVAETIANGPNFRYTVYPVQTGVFIPKGSVFAVDEEGERVASEDFYLVMPTKDIKEKDVDVGLLAHKLEIS